MAIRDDVAPRLPEAKYEMMMETDDARHELQHRRAELES